MRKLTEEVLLELGFEKVIVTAEESGDNEFYYFTLDLTGDGRECLISDASDQVDNGEFVVDMFNTELGTCYTDEDVKTLYDALTKYKK